MIELQIMGTEDVLTVDFTVDFCFKLRHLCNVVLKTNETYPDDEPVSTLVPVPNNDGEYIVTMAECRDNGVIFHLESDEGSHETEKWEIGDIKINNA